MEPLGQDIKKNNKEFAIGIDITDTYSQISVAGVETESVETVSVVPGQTNFMVPTALFKRAEVNQWFVGNDAVKYKDTEGYYVDGLISKARDGQEVTVGNDSFRPSALLALFLKRLLTLANPIASPSAVTSVMITVDVLDHELVTALTEAVSSLSLKAGEIHFQNHMESFYNYVLYQPRELWMRDVVLFDATGEYIRSLRMECNKNTTPVVAFIDSHEDVRLKISNIDEPGFPGLFGNFTDSVMDSHEISGIYLIGDAFKEEWCKDSIAKLCTRGRVFQGNNLFSKGAALGAKNVVSPSVISSGYVFLGNDKLKSNVGLNVKRRGENSYLALLDGGINWFDAHTECDIILDQGNRLLLVITPLTGKNPELAEITLGDLPKRPPKTTRLNLKIRMQSENRMQITIKDLGFGELFPSSNIEWNEVISV